MDKKNGAPESGAPLGDIHMKSVSGFGRRTSAQNAAHDSASPPANSSQNPVSDRVSGMFEADGEGREQREGEETAKTQGGAGAREACGLRRSLCGLRPLTAPYRPRLPRCPSESLPPCFAPFVFVVIVPSLLVVLRVPLCSPSCALWPPPGSPVGGSRPLICPNPRNLRFPLAVHPVLHGPAPLTAEGRGHKKSPDRGVGAFRAGARLTCRRGRWRQRSRP